MDTPLRSITDAAAKRTANTSEMHNASVDEDAARAGECGQVHLPTGRMCTLPHGHAGSCEFISAEAAAASAEMHSPDPARPSGKVHILPVGRCTCPHSPAPAASSSTDALCTSEVLAVRLAAASVIERRGVSMTGTNSFLSHARGHQPQTGTTSRIPLHFHRCGGNETASTFTRSATTRPTSAPHDSDTRWSRPSSLNALNWR